MKNSLLFLALLCSFSFRALGVGCGEVNLITVPHSPFSRIPVYDQKDTNLCYAYSAAQLMDYYLIQEGAPSRNVHPAWVALNYARSKNKTGLYIGHTKEAIESVKAAGNCQYDLVSTALASFGKKDVPEAGILKLIEKYSSSKTELVRAPASKDLSLTPVQLLSHLVGPSCPEEIRKAVNVPEVRKFNYQQLPVDSAFEKFMVSRLDEKKYPLSIAYCSKVWKEPDYDGIHLNLSLVRDALDNDCDYHESLIVGKKSVNGQCQILVRNSLGDGWWGGKNWNCLCKNRKTGAFSDDCKPQTHPTSEYSVEACWIPSDKLARNTGVVTFLE